MTVRDFGRLRSLILSPFKKRGCLIVDQSLSDAAGHHLNVTQALSKSLRAAGYRTRVLAHSAFPADEHEGIDAEPLFPNRCYDAMFLALERPARFDALSAKFSVELSVFLKNAGERQIVLPTLTCMELQGLATWIKSHSSPDQVSVYFWLVFGPEFLTSDARQVKQAEAWYAEGFAALEEAAKTGARIYPIVETQGLRERWQPATNLEISVIRLPSMVHHLASQKKPDQTDGIVVGYGGDVRAGKGFELLPDVVQAVRKRHPEVRFDIRVAIDPDHDHSETLDALQQFGAGVSVRVGSMLPLEFQAFLAQCDLLLLPYDAEIYANRGSSICDEAEVLGLPQIVPSQVSFAQKVLSTGSAFAFDKHDAGSVAGTLCRALDGFDDLTQNARANLKNITDQNQTFVSLMTR